MKRIALLMVLTLALVALGSFAPVATHWRHAALACDGGDGSSGDGGNSGSGT